MRFKLADLVRLGCVSLPDDDVLLEELAFCRSSWCRKRNYRARPTAPTR